MTFKMRDLCQKHLCVPEALADDISLNPHIHMAPHFCVDRV